MPGFDSVRRYRDALSSIVVVRLLPGECYVTREDEMLDTVLGSCVAACVRNTKTGIGGMNHFMLPNPRIGELSDSWGAVTGNATRYGGASMEQLISCVLNVHGSKDDLEVKIFGGARLLATDIGRHNVEFVREYLRNEGLSVSAEDVGGTAPRHIQYFPISGKARVKRLVAEQSATLLSEEIHYGKTLDERPMAGSVDLF
ncbi:MAG: chemoreceptor glutamine deamidase CheD [Steroidobacteraceae bacterium]